MKNQYGSRRKGNRIACGGANAHDRVGFEDRPWQKMFGAVVWFIAGVY